MNPPPPSSTLFPYTTLFRSQCLPCPGQERITIIDRTRPARFDIEIKLEKVLGAFDAVDIGRLRDAIDALNARSEEHTSELQSHHDLVCRLLLEKKKKKNIKNAPENKKRADKQIIIGLVPPLRVEPAGVTICM